MPEYLRSETHADGDRYYFDTEGNKYVSCTTILGKYEDKTNLNRWYEKNGKEFCDAYNEKRRYEGDQAHLDVEHHLKYKSKMDYRDELPCNTPHGKSAIKHFYSKVKYISAEVPFVWSDGVVGFGGKYDHLVEIPGDTFCIVDSYNWLQPGYVLADLKSKDKSVDPTKLDVGGLKHMLQGAAYWQAIEANTGYSLNYFILVTASKTKARMAVMDKSDQRYYWGVFYRLLLDYYGKEEIGLTWQDLVTEATGVYNFDTGKFDHYLPLEIL